MIRTTKLLAPCTVWRISEFIGWGRTGSDIYLHGRCTIARFINERCLRRICVSIEKLGVQRYLSVECKL